MYSYVASLAEAWIEIFVLYNHNHRKEVASLAEAWIEIRQTKGNSLSIAGRLPRGGVD